MTNGKKVYLVAVSVTIALTALWIVNWFLTPQALGAFGEVKVDRLAFMGEIREITAYNAGDPMQNDMTPCIAASGENVCQTVALGYKRIATNKEPLGTCLLIEGLGEFKVVDRMNKRFSDRIDIAMQAHEKKEAVAFGLQKRKVIRVECSK